MGACRHGFPACLPACLNAFVRAVVVAGWPVERGEVVASSMESIDWLACGALAVLCGWIEESKRVGRQAGKQ